MSLLLFNCTPLALPSTLAKNCALRCSAACKLLLLKPGDAGAGVLPALLLNPSVLTDPDPDARYSDTMMLLAGVPATAELLPGNVLLLIALNPASLAPLLNTCCCCCCPWKPFPKGLETPDEMLESAAAAAAAVLLAPVAAACCCS
jgi:hypothetical protein